jgi:hypothetical protein
MMPLGRITAESIKLRTLLPALGTADTVILVDFDNLPSHAAGDFAQLALLVGRGLLDCGNPQVENSAFHR